MTDEIDRVIAGLTEAAKARLLETPFYSEGFRTPADVELIDKGLVSKSFKVLPIDSETRFLTEATRKGLAVRARLQERQP